MGIKNVLPDGSEEKFDPAKYPRTERYVEEKLTRGIRCNRCGAPVIKSELDGYVYQCMSCDEDLYSIETHKGKPATEEEMNELLLNTRDLLLLDEVQTL